MSRGAPDLNAEDVPPAPADQPGVQLFWLPLGAGGHFVKFNGRCYEAMVALRERRPRRDIFHAALTVHGCSGRFVIELAPVVGMGDRDRGVVLEGPVGARQAGRLAAFRYEVRVWQDGVIPDASEAVESPIRLGDADLADRLLALAPSVPPLTWGRDERGTGDMWNSNSVIAWLLQRSGVDAAAIRPPHGGRAPGWDAGVAIASLQPT